MKRIILFRTTIFKEEKDKSDEGFVLVNKEIKEEKEDNNIIEEDNKENAMNISGISDENEFLYGKCPTYITDVFFGFVNDSIAF